MARRWACEEQKHKHSWKIAHILQRNELGVFEEKNDECSLSGEIEEEIGNT